MSRRAIDVGVATVVLIATLPLHLVIALVLFTTEGLPVLFRQERIGKGDLPFGLVKFRTIREAVDASGTPLPDEQRLTKFGEFLRRFSLDELPELWNVLIGDMSLVGPRPLPVRYLPRYRAVERRRHELKPGLTGWAQVNGRNAIAWDDRLALDVWYVDNRNWSLDARIVLRTIPLVVRGEGVSGEKRKTMSELRPDLHAPNDLA